MKNADRKAFAIIDACVTQLRDLGGGEIPVRWAQHFSKGARQGKKLEPNQLHIQIAAEYLNDWSKSNPALPVSELATNHSTIPDEEPARRGLLQELARKHGMHHSSVSEIINTTLEKHRIETMLKAIDLSIKDLICG